MTTPPALSGMHSRRVRVQPVEITVATQGNERPMGIEAVRSHGRTRQALKTVRPVAMASSFRPQARMM
jgi:hypothetical protein